MQVCHVQALQVLVRDIEVLVRDTLGIIIILRCPSKMQHGIKDVESLLVHVSYVCVLALSPDPFSAC